MHLHFDTIFPSHFALFLYNCFEFLKNLQKWNQPIMKNLWSGDLHFYQKRGYKCPVQVFQLSKQWKKPNTLNYPIPFVYFGAKFSRILHENRIFSNLCFLCKHLAMFNSSQSKRLTIARCKIKWLCSEFMKYLRKFGYVF